MFSSNEEDIEAVLEWILNINQKLFICVGIRKLPKGWYLSIEKEEDYDGNNSA